jgi:PTS system mannose-specific IIC component
MNWAVDLSVLQWALLAALVIVGALDRTAMAQTLLCRPIVCGPLCGLIMGDYAAGLLMGAIMELLWLMRLPVGATVAPDDTQATIAAVFLFCGFNSGLDSMFPPQILMVIIVFFAAVFAPLGRLLDIGARHMNGRIQHRLGIRLESGRASDLGTCLRWANLAGLANFIFAGVLGQIVILSATLASVVLVVPYFAGLTLHGSDIPLYAAILAGVAAVFACIRVRHAVILFGAGFGITYFLTLV